jgi:uncharacterized membrane protein YbhN (UPF0104 family)
MKWSWTSAAKLAVLLAIAVLVGIKVTHAWRDAAGQRVTIDWRYAPLAVAGFGGVMVSSGLVWRRLAGQMGTQGHTVRFVAAYLFSQMGKYVPGKLFLLWMRIDRSQPYGMDAATCTLSTLLENALYMISGALVGTVAVVRISAQLTADGHATAAALLWPATLAVIGALGAACHPAIFYGLVQRLLPTMNRLLARLKRPPIEIRQRLSSLQLAASVILFFPCWICGAIALWAAAACVHPIPLVDSLWFAGAFALSVIIGMASFLPAGIGIREAVLGAALMLQFEAGHVPHEDAVKLATVAVLLQRLFQITAEALFGICGGLVARKRKATPVTAEGTVSSPEAVV